MITCLSVVRLCFLTAFPQGVLELDVQLGGHKFWRYSTRLDAHKSLACLNKKGSRCMSCARQRASETHRWQLFGHCRSGKSCQAPSTASCRVLAHDRAALNPAILVTAEQHILLN